MHILLKIKTNLNIYYRFNLTTYITLVFNVLCTYIFLNILVKMKSIIYVDIFKDKINQSNVKYN